MNLATVRYIAQNKGVTPGSLCKQDLIRTIQVNEGNAPCFATAEEGFCREVECHWHEDCLRRSRGR
ncbi:MAG: SAP domain-containing protein [Chromatiaceae bacterium]|nr:hypothetical protein ECTOBSL9_1906 [Ectothiorhodospira sp. BSL-9]TVQ71277.1 MAG: SAP domain-containing protein [Chromatiaceae bacterium]